MSMYDNLGEYQIKVFGVPCYYDTAIMGGLSLMGGRLRYYKIGETLPLKTMWYKFPESFTILDKYFDEEKNCYDGFIVHIIKDSKYFNSVKLEDFDEKDIGKNTYNYYGVKLNIKTKDDMFSFIKLNNELNKKLKEIELSYFENGVHYCIHNDMKKYEKLSPKYHEDVQKIKDTYNSKLFMEEEFKNEMILGEYLDVVIPAFDESTKKTDCIRNYAEFYQHVKADMKKFIESQDGDYLNKYFNWCPIYLDEKDKKLLTEFINNVIMK